MALYASPAPSVNVATAVLPLAATFQRLGFAEGDRAAIIMSNQSKWLLLQATLYFE